MLWIPAQMIRLRPLSLCLSLDLDLFLVAGRPRQSTKSLPRQRHARLLRYRGITPRPELRRRPGNNHRKQSFTRC